jgi:hypothetical protein
MGTCRVFDYRTVSGASGADELLARGIEAASRSNTKNSKGWVLTEFATFDGGCSADLLGRVENVRRNSAEPMFRKKCNEGF